MSLRLVLAATALAAAAAAFAPPALASEVYRSSYRDSPTGPQRWSTIVRALPGETNDVSIAYDPGTSVYLIEDKAGIRVMSTADPAGQGCVSRSPTTVACSWPHISHVSLGDGNDRLVVTSAAAPDTVRAVRDRTGREYVVSAPRGVNASGGPGDDVMLGNAGADVLVGEAIDGNGRVQGTGNDTIDGGDGPDELIGYAGNDRVTGGGGDDIVAGGTGDDVVDAGDGEDDLEWSEVSSGEAALTEGADRLLGGAGNDEIFALRGRDSIDAGAGADRVFSYESDARPAAASTIACGAGPDWVDPGRGDVVSGCEQLWVALGCRRCSVTVEANVGGKRVVLATFWITVTRRQGYLLVPLGSRAVRSLLQRSPSVRLRWTQPGRRGLVTSDWFVLRR
jgi:hypothetical protein